MMLLKGRLVRIMGNDGPKSLSAMDRLLVLACAALFLTLFPAPARRQPQLPFVQPAAAPHPVAKDTPVDESTGVDKNGYYTPSARSGTGAGYPTAE
jgi:hypothetical protein